MSICKLLIVLLLFSFALVSFAQDTGQLTGSVKDSSGASVAGAQVTVSSPERGIRRETKTNRDGEYLVSGLPAGSYNLAIAASGFKTYQATNIILRVAQKARADAGLEVGAAATEVTVEGSGIGQVETQSAELSGVVTAKQITQLELNGRNFTQLATLVPGVNNQSGQDEGTVGITGNVSFSFNGGRTEYNNWELDGGDNMDNGSNSSLNVYPSVDAIQEVKVLTSNYGAQYGRSGSGTVEVETKSGTRQFHGDLYEFVRNDVFNARNYFQSQVPPYKKNDFGYTVGGPVFFGSFYNREKDKTFFFWSQEWRRDRVPGANFNTTVPTAAERAGDFSDVCPGPDCPNIGPIVPVSPVGQALLALIPAPNLGTNTFQAAPIQPTNWREELFRIDHNFSSKLRAMFRYTHDTWETISPTSQWTGSSFPTVQSDFKGPATSLVARLTANPTPTLLNEFTFSYTTDHISFTSTGFPNPNAWKLPANFPMGYLFQNGAGGKLPVINVAAGQVSYNSIFEDPNSEWPEGPYNSNPTYTFRDNITKSLGRHNLQFGAYYVAAQKNERSSLLVSGELSFNPTAPNSTGNAFADMLMGNIAAFSQGSNNLKFYNRYKIFEPYVQDDWRVNDKLTLNLGLRVSMFGTYREKYKHAYNWDPTHFNPANAPQIDTDGSITGFPGALVPGTGDPFNGLVQCGTNGVPVSCMKGHLFNPAPRIGFAYDPTGRGKTALRGGYGIFFEHMNGNEGNTEALEGQSSPLLQTVTQYNIVGYENIGGTNVGATPTFPHNFISIPNKAVWPYIQQWHLDVQQEVLKNTVMTVSYVGSKGTHLNRQLNLNQILPLPLSQNPYLPGEAIGPNDCSTFMTPSGATITGQAAINLAVACGSDPNPYRPHYGIGNITRLEDKASSIYHALQVSARRNIGALQLNLAYTWSHSIDDSSDRYDAGFVDSYNPSANRASSSFNIRHMLNVGYIWDLPFFKQPGVMNTVLGGWQFSGITSWQTGTPFSAVNNVNFPDNAGVAAGSIAAGSYADIVGDPNANIPKDQLANYGPLVANPNAFAAPRGLTFGNSGRNRLRNPGFTNFNMALFKRFAIKERSAFEFRAEAFNVFNHTEWAPLAGDAGSAAYNGLTSATNGFGSSTFLRIGAAHAPRILQLGAKFIF